jgi:hypothetical protein
MTAGALIQIKNGYADRMAFLTFNPQVSYFKSVYKRYTNFAHEYINLLPDSSADLTEDQDTSISFKIKRDSDLMNKVYFCFELPDIYSRNGLDFQWIQRIGEYIIKDVSFQVGSNLTLDRQYGEYLHIWSELNLNKEQKEGYYKMIGHTTDIYDPASIDGHGGYPGSSNSTRKVYPSVLGRKIYVPLRFWFNLNVANSFPLIGVQYEDIKINFTLRPLKELYTVLNGGSPNLRIRPNTSGHNIGNFFETSDSTSSLNINPTLEIKHIFLDAEERKRFAINSLEYLSHQVQRVQSQTVNDANFLLNLKDLNKPVTQIHFIIRRSDFEDKNLWSNFTNWPVPSSPFYADNYTSVYYDQSSITFSDSNIKYYKTKELLKSSELRLDASIITNGNSKDYTATPPTRLEGKDNRFFNLVTNYEGNNSVPDEGIYTYSFNLNNGSNQPYGACNMSTITNKDLRLFLNEVNSGDGFSYSYNIYVYAENLEIIKVMGGLANEMFSN